VQSMMEAARSRCRKNDMSPTGDAMLLPSMIDAWLSASEKTCTSGSEARADMTDVFAAKPVGKSMHSSVPFSFASMASSSTWSDV
jgi:hypothetical protein